LSISSGGNLLYIPVERETLFRVSLAYIFFAERWTDDISRRDPLRDQYVILFFSAEGKFTRMFSNIADIPPIFPRSEASWHRLMWGEPKLKK
jgi:hypothetical protein